MNATLRQTVMVAMTCGLAVIAQAANVDIADKPMTSTPKVIKPNVMFLLDASGSMDGDVMPDDVPTSGSKYAYKSSQCNGLAFNPANSYDPPLRSDGTSAPNASFTAAWDDGYVLEALNRTDSSTSIAIGTGSKVFTLASGSPISTAGLVQIAARSDRTQYMVGTVTSYSGSTRKLTVNVTATSGSGTYSSWTMVNLVDLSASTNKYYTYSGSQPAVGYTYSSTGSLDTSTTFYKECNSSVGSLPGSGVFTAATVTSSSVDAQKYANWYSYYRTRILTMKTAMSLAFGKLVDPQNFRVGFSTIAYSGVDSTNDMFLKIDDYCSAATNCQQRQDFFTKIFRATATSWTPLRNALSKAGLIYAGKLMAAAEDPVQYYCQKNWAILSTDGYWNTGGGSGDGSGGDYWKDAGGFTLGGAGTYPTAGSGVGKQDGATNGDYVDANGTTVTMKRPMLDGNDYSNTLADVAEYYYKTDLRDSALSNCTSGSSARNVCPDKVPMMPEDCNPRQHMNSITFGLGVNGTLNASDYPAAASSTSDWYKLKNGSTPAVNWPNPSSSDARTIDDLWHTAVNGRGTYYHPSNPSSIANDLSKALAKVASTVGGASAAGVSALQLSASSPNYVYLSNYTDGLWDGDIQAFTISSTGVLSGTGAVSGTCNSSTTGGSAIWSARTQLQAMAASSRVIYTAKGGWGNFNIGNASLTATDFDTTKLSQYVSFTATEKSFATRDNLITYLRGEDHVQTPAGSGNYCCENQSNNTYKLFRDRDYKLGDIVHSTPYYVGTSPFQYSDLNYKQFKSAVTDTSTGMRTAMLFAGANDGMMHAFNANTGNEAWAFVPSAVVPNLYKLADFAYNSNHQFFVDGQINVGDICPSAPGAACSTSTWKTILVGGLGEGGRDVYALDITNTASPTLLWEFAAKNPSAAVNMGRSFGTPLIAKIKGGANNGRWVVIFSSGYNNVSPGDGTTHLFVVDAYTGALIWDINGFGSEMTADLSGMGSVSAWADSGITDNSVQHVYGGDLNGNVWRFDISTGAAGNVVKLATLADAGGTRQPVTTKPELGEAVTGATKSRVVFVGTGKWMGFYADIPTSNSLPPSPPPAPVSSTWNPLQTQSLYAIKDDLSTTYGNFRSSGATQMSITGGATSRAVSYPSAASTQGWYVDFPVGGERVTVDPELQVGWLSVTTNLPSASDDCMTGGESFHYFFDYNPTAARTTTASWEATYVASALASGSGTVQTANGATGVIVSDASGKMQFISNQAPSSGSVVRRISWRELTH